MAQEVEAERPVDPDTVRNLARMAQLQLAGLTHEFSSLPARFVNDDAQAAAATHYVQAAAGACRSLLLRIAASRRASTKPRSRDRSAGRGDRHAVRARGATTCPRMDH